MNRITQQIWSVFSTASNTLCKGVYFLKTRLTPDTSRPTLLPIIDRNVKFKSDNLRIADEARLAEISRLVEFGRLSSGIFHDLINPLTTILLAVEDAHGNNSLHSQSDRENLERALLASRRIKDFMSVARKGLEQHAAKDEFSPAREIRDVCELLAYKCRRSNIHLSLDLDNSISMKGCPLAFFRIALNLVSNAIDSYEHASSKINIVSVRLSSSSSKILLSISDHGCGIPKTKIQEIFEPFYSTKKTKGLGIGLFTAKQLVEKLDGIIRVESIEGFGTTFFIEFKASQDYVDKKAACAAFSKNLPIEQSAHLQEV
jgi:two-component system, sporulation sensor kinase E